VITHAHEDHLGAVVHLWPQFRCPVHATPFAAAVLRASWGKRACSTRSRSHDPEPRARFRLGPFDLEFIRVAHSVPEAQALAIRTRHGLVLHTGDWKLDPDPLIGPRTDEAAFAALGEEGVLAMVCDSTNAMVEGHSGSEAEVRRNLAALIRGLKGRVAVTCFASNVARLESIALAGRAAGRQVALFGRSLRNIEQAARDCGYLKSIPPFVPEEEAGYLPDDEILLICTGSQGEPRAPWPRSPRTPTRTSRSGRGTRSSSPPAASPAMSAPSSACRTALRARGCRVMTDDDHMVHVSGHPARDELRRLYALVKPRFAVPVHGEWRHMQEHAGLATECGAVPFLIEDGDALRLSGNRPEVCESVPSGRLAVDGERLVPMDGSLLAQRRRMMFNGVVVASLAVDAQGRLLGDPQISAPGLFDTGDPEPGMIAAELRRGLADMPAALRRGDDELREAVRATLRKQVGRRLRKRPTVEVHVIRV
jgi:ribonuclease J